MRRSERIADREVYGCVELKRMCGMHRDDVFICPDGRAWRLLPTRTVSISVTRSSR